MYGITVLFPLMILHGLKALAVPVLGASQNYTFTIGDTARLFSPRSDREHLKDFKKYYASKENTPFAVIENGAPTAKCLNDDLEPFCLAKVQFQVWNKTHLLLEINNTNHEDSGEYDVDHVFGGLEGNHKDVIYLEIKEMASNQSYLTENPTSKLPPDDAPTHTTSTVAPIASLKPDPDVSAGIPSNSSTVTSSLKPHPKAGKLKVGQIVGMVLGILVALILPALFYYLCKKRQQRKEELGGGSSFNHSSESREREGNSRNRYAENHL